MMNKITQAFINFKKPEIIIDKDSFLNVKTLHLMILTLQVILQLRDSL